MSDRLDDKIFGKIYSIRYLVIFCTGTALLCLSGPILEYLGL